jgi:hypothetical protein
MLQYKNSPAVHTIFSPKIDKDFAFRYKAFDLKATTFKYSTFQQARFDLS